MQEPIKGGASSCGRVFKIDPAGHETVVHSFKGPLQKDGCNPSGGVTMDDSGNLYGVKWAGGGNDAGTVYKVDANGDESLLYSFPWAAQEVRSRPWSATPRATCMG